MDNLGVLRVPGGPGERPHVAGLQKIYALRYGPVLWGADSVMFSAAALVHAIDAVCGSSIALQYFN